jgi:hypothetical protein
VILLGQMKPMQGHVWGKWHTLSVFDEALPIAADNYVPRLEDVGHLLLRISRSDDLQLAQGLALAALDLLADIARRQAAESS